MKIAVFGATGMIGSRLAAEADRRGHQVTAVSRSGTLPKGTSKAIAMENQTYFANAVCTAPATKGES